MLGEIEYNVVLSNILANFDIVWKNKIKSTYNISDFFQKFPEIEKNWVKNGKKN